MSVSRRDENVNRRHNPDDPQASNAALELETCGPSGWRCGPAGDGRRRSWESAGRWASGSERGGCPAASKLLSRGIIGRRGPSYARLRFALGGERVGGRRRGRGAGSRVGLARGTRGGGVRLRGRGCPGSCCRRGQVDDVVALVLAGVVAADAVAEVDRALGSRAHVAVAGGVAGLADGVRGDATIVLTGGAAPVGESTSAASSVKERRGGSPATVW